MVFYCCRGSDGGGSDGPVLGGEEEEVSILMAGSTMTKTVWQHQCAGVYNLHTEG